MESKPQKLALRLDNINEYLRSRLEQEPSFADLIVDLEAFARTLREEKLSVKLVAHSLPVAEALQQSIARQPQLSQRYQGEAIALPQPVDEARAVVVLGDRTASYPLPQHRERILIGRLPECEIQLGDEYNLVSRQHAQLCPTQEGGWSICDLGSSNGLYFNRRQLSSHLPQVLNNGDRFSCGNPNSPGSAEFTFLLRGQEPLAWLYPQETIPTGEATFYTLPEKRLYIIGRQPGCDLTIPNRYASVSRQHAEIRYQEARNCWQLRDRGSSNGTYLNGNPVGETWVDLKTGDRLTIGKLDAPDGLVLGFEELPVLEEERARVVIEDGDLVCTLSQGHRELSPAEKAFLEPLAKETVHQVIVIIDNSSPSPENPDPMALTRSWLDEHLGAEKVEVLTLPWSRILEASSQAPDEVLAPFYQLLVGQSEGAVENLLRRLMKQITSHIERTFEEKESRLKAQLQQPGVAEGTRVEELKIQLNKALKQISKDQERTFRQIKKDIDQSRGEIINPFISTSLIFKLQQFIDDLKPLKVKQGNQEFLRLYSEQLGENQSIHDRVIEICETEFDRWLVGEWDRACNLYADGGLSGFLSRTQVAIAAILPSSPLTTQLPPPPTFDVKKFLDASVLEGNSRIFYGEGSNTGNIIGIGLGVALVPLTPLPLLFQGVNVFRQRDMERSKLEQKTDALKRNIGSKYQSLAKFLAERIMQTAIAALDEESQRYQEMLTELGEQASEQISEYKKASERLKNSRAVANKEKAEIVKRLKGESA